MKPRTIADGGGPHWLRASYTVYGIGCAVVWAVLLAVVAARGSSGEMHNVWFVFFGWVIGWSSATIARFVYPPPKSNRSVHAAS